jgi:hypothetical protein
MERDAGDQFHHQEVNAVFATKLVDRLNIRMVQLAERERLAAKALARGFVGESSRVQHFERNVAFQLFVVRTVHHAHAAGADLGDDTIVRYGPIEHASLYARPDLPKRKFRSLI